MSNSAMFNKNRKFRRRQISLPPGGIQTRNRNNTEADDPHVRPRGNWDRNTLQLPRSIYRHWHGRRLDHDTLFTFNVANTITEMKLVFLVLESLMV